MNTFLLSLLASTALSSAASIPRQVNGPTVTIKNGTLVGQNAGKIDSFLGIPYAQPPVGDLRLKQPQAIQKSYGTLKLPSTPTACPQMTLSSINDTGLPTRAQKILEAFSQRTEGLQGEDCLTINVQRPSNISSNAKLPVMFWIYGGGWEIGRTQDYDGSQLVNKSLNMGTPMVFVAVNYRVNAFGFLAGKQLQKEGNTNLGLHDQRLGLQWVAENIAAFGGDPDRVTIWGESAGAVSVMDQMVINGGDNTYKGKPLFHGAIMNSGGIIPTLPVDTPKAQNVFDQVATAAGCSPANYKNPLQCLRNVSYETYLKAMNSLPNFNQYESNNLAYLRRPDPSSKFYPTSTEILVAQGKFARVPVITGSQEDEGTLFGIVQRNITTTDDLITYFQGWFPEATRETVAGLVATYPDNAAAGSPYNTGNQYEIYPQYKRNAAIQGDYTFIMERRNALESLSCKVPSWSYLATYGNDIPLLGTYHTLDIRTLFYFQNYPQAADTINTYYINFVNKLDPNHAGVLKNWPKWETNTRQLVNFSATDVTYLKDDFRQESGEYLKAHTDTLKQ